MAIKINNKDLYRRVINGQDVQRVILNGSQIRPTGQPHIDYHVISNRGTGGGGGGGSGIPGGWGVGGSTVIEEAGVSNGRTGQTANLKYNGLPSLLNAYKVEIIYSFYRDGTDVSTPFESYLLHGSEDSYRAKIYKQGTAWTLYLQTATQWNQDIMYNYTGRGDYVMTAVLDLENETATLTLSGPDSYEKEVEISLTATDIYEIRHSDSFWVYLNDGVRLSRVDFYVYNNPPEPPQPTEEIYINTDLTDTTGIVGNQIAVYLYINPLSGGLVQESGPVEFDHIGRDSGEGYNMILYYNVIGVGTATVGFNVSRGGSATMQINCIE